MSQLDGRLGHGYSSAGNLNRLPAMMALDEQVRMGSLGKNDRRSPARPAAPATIGQAELRRVVLVESDQYYREVLTFELLRQGFVVHAFADGASLLGSLATAVDADLAALHRRDRGGRLSGERAVRNQAHPQQVPRLRPRLRRDRELHRLRVLLAQAILGLAGEKQAQPA
jgi:hypothetical protein